MDFFGLSPRVFSHAAAARTFLLVLTLYGAHIATEVDGKRVGNGNGIFVQKRGDNFSGVNARENAFELPLPPLPLLSLRLLWR